jgi:hypothetical protein
MGIAEFVIELLKIILSSQVVIVSGFFIFCWKFKEDIKSLMNRIKVLKGPGGYAGEFSQPAPALQEIENLNFDATEDKNEYLITDTSQSDLSKTIDELKVRLKDSETVSRHWQFQYLDSFLVLKTKQMLEFIGGESYIPMTRSSFDKISISIGGGDEGMLNALLKLNLVEVLSDNDPRSTEVDLISITKKGGLFLDWYQTHKLPYTD